MASLLVDVNIKGHAQLIFRHLTNSPWSEFTELLKVQFLDFDDVGLPEDAPDNIVWRLCQQEGYWLLTANRNSESPSSLQSTIKAEGTVDSIPVITISKANRLYRSKKYLDEVSKKILDYLIDADQYLGTGRLFAP